MGKFLKQEREGAETLEYVVVAAVVFTIFAAFFGAVRQPLQDRINEVATFIDTATLQ